MLGVVKEMLLMIERVQVSRRSPRSGIVLSGSDLHYFAGRDD